jgi:hypothetical protein
VVSCRLVPFFLNENHASSVLPDNGVYFGVCMDSGGGAQKTLCHPAGFRQQRSESGR